MRHEIFKVVKADKRPTLASQLLALKTGEAIIFTGKQATPYKAGRRYGFKVQTQKQKDGTLLVWRVG